MGGSNLWDWLEDELDMDPNDKKDEKIGAEAVFQAMSVVRDGGPLFSRSLPTAFKVGSECHCFHFPSSANLLNES